MRRRLVTTGSTLALAAATFLPGLVPSSQASGAQPATTPIGTAKTLLGTVPAIVHQALDLGGLDPDRTLSVELPLVLPDRGALDHFVNAEYRKDSPTYHQFVSPATFGARFGAPAATVGKVAQTLSALGLQVQTPTANHLFVKASAPVGLLESVFATKLSSFSLPKGVHFFANTTNITLPRQLVGAVTGVIGLDNAARPMSQLQRIAHQPAGTAKPAGIAKPAVGPVGKNGGPSPCAAAVAGAGYTAPQLATAYNFNGLYKKHLLGQGMSAALVEFDDFHASNVATVESCYNVHTPVTREVVAGGTGGPPGAAEIEDMADITTMLEMLPKLAHLLVYVAPTTNLGEIDLYNQFATDDAAPVLSSSWGNCEELESEADNQLFATIAEEAAAQGQQIFESAGDSGAVDCRGFPAPTSGSISVEQEAAVPWLTGVGGTDLGQKTANGIGGARDEATWNDDGAGGGGVSTMWPMPAWQRHLKSARTAPGHSSKLCGAAKGKLCREVPDISADASSGLGQQGSHFQFTGDLGSVGYSIYCGTPNCALVDELGLPIPVLPIGLPGGLTGWEPVGGTSLSAPLTASAAVLWDQLANRRHLSGLGLLNPSLYRVAAKPKRYRRDFHDITTDSNSAQYDTGDCPTGCNPHHLYKARKGYDMATGLGSYDATKLGIDMVKQAGVVTLTPDRVHVYGYTHGVATTSPVVVSSAYKKLPSYFAHSNRSWLHVKPGRSPGQLRWFVNPKGVRRGVHHGRIDVRSHGNLSSLSVVYAVSKPAKLHVSTKRLHFRERAVDDNDKPTTASCGSTLWNDELYDAVNFSSGTPVDKSTKRVLHIRNAGPRGSILHWQAFPYSDTSSWLGQDLTRGKVQTKPSRPLVPTGGADKSGRSSALHLASTGNINQLAGEAPLNQGTYHGQVKLTDLADPRRSVIVHAVMTLGTGKHTPRIAAKVRRHVTVHRGRPKTIALHLRDASHSCGFAYSASDDRAWAHPSAAAYSGTVTGHSTGTIPIKISPNHLERGNHRLHITVQSQNAEPNPKVVTVVVHVA